MSRPKNRWPPHGRGDGADEKNGFKHPQYGPGVSFPKKEFDDRILRRLDAFARGDDHECAFEPMTSCERKRLHELANRKGLVSESRGHGASRYTTVSKKRHSTNMKTQSTATELQEIQLDDEQIAAIDGLAKTMPIQVKEIEAHLDTSKSLRGGYRTRRAAQQHHPLVPKKPTPPPHISAFRQELPVHRFQDDILKAIAHNEVTLITGGTGCGKTTQVPQFILEQCEREGKPVRIICTQPRRLPAIAVSQRVAHERGEKLPDTVGYHIRLEQKVTDKTMLMYCTAGVLLRMLTKDDESCGATHIILDEVHEREKNTDYLLIALREALKKKSKIKVILMSATMEGNIDLFKEYFKCFRVAHIDVPSKLFDVKTLFLGDVIAMTGYCPPPSTFGSAASNVWNDPGSMLRTTNSCSNFPIGQYDPYQGTSHYAHNGNFSDMLTHNQTAPDLRHYNTPSPQVNLISSQIAALELPHVRNGQSFSGQYQHHSMLHEADTMGQPEIEELAMSDDESEAKNTITPQDSFSGQPLQAPLKHNYASANWSQPNAGNQSWTHTQSCATMTSPPALDQRLYHWQDTNIYPQPPRFYLDQGNSGYQGTFEDQMRHETEQMRLRRDRLMTALSRRYPVFCEEVVKDLEKHKKAGDLTEEEMVNLYLQCGGNQYSENVDHDICVRLVMFLMNSPIDGAILIFLPGFDDISTMRAKLEDMAGNLRQKLHIYCLHSQMHSFDQQRVFSRIHDGGRKVILSTNISEASLTIDDVVFVIDCGKVKEKTYEHDSRISQLKVQWIARSNAEQRSGRAGRCRNGFCFRLYSLAEYDAFLPSQAAELQRVAIYEVVLHAKMFAGDQVSVREFIRQAPEPPRAESVESSISFLEQLGALYDQAANNDEIDPRPERLSFYQMQQNFQKPGFYNTLGFLSMKSREPMLTPLGRTIALLPLEPQLARLLLFGVALKCLDPIISLVSILSHRDPFIIPHMDDREGFSRMKEGFGRRDLSDHLMFIRTYIEYTEQKKKGHSPLSIWAQKNYIQMNAMKMIEGIKRQLSEELRRTGIIQTNSDETEMNLHSGSWPMVRAAIVAGCYPGVGYVRIGNRLKKIRTTVDQNCGLHTSSCIRRQLMNRNTDNQRNGEPKEEPHIEYVVFQELSRMEGQSLTLRTVTVVPPLAMLLFSGTMRLKKATFDYFKIDAEHDVEELGSDEEQEAAIYPALSILELDDWFGAKGRRAHLRRVVQLRFRIMDYFLKVMEQPKLLYTRKYDDLLKTIRTCLEVDHESHHFNPVSSLPVWKVNEQERAQNLPPDLEQTRNTQSSHSQSSLSWDENPKATVVKVFAQQRRAQQEEVKAKRVVQPEAPLEAHPPPTRQQSSSSKTDSRDRDPPRSYRESPRAPYRPRDTPQEQPPPPVSHDDNDAHRGPSLRGTSGPRGMRGTFRGRSNDVRNDGAKPYYHQYDKYSKRNSGGAQQDNAVSGNSQGNSRAHYSNNHRRHERHKDYEEQHPQDPPQSSSDRNWRQNHGYDNCTPLPETNVCYSRSREEEVLPHSPEAGDRDDDEEPEVIPPPPVQNAEGGGRNNQKRRGHNNFNRGNKEGGGHVREFRNSKRGGFDPHKRGGASSRRGAAGRPSE